MRTDCALGFAAGTEAAVRAPVLLLDGPPKPAPALLDSPEVLACVQGGAGALAPRPGESEEEHQHRVGTYLMAAWRDTRSPVCFEALYALTHRAVLRWLAGLLRGGTARLDARELLQDTFVNVYLYPSGFRDEHAGSYRVWVRTIAGNLVRRALARAGTSYAALPEGSAEPADAREGPESQASNGEQLEHLRQAWLLFLCLYARAAAELAQRDRRALELVEVQGLRYEEAGRELAVGRSNMKMIVFRARRRLSARMRVLFERAAETAVLAPAESRARISA